VSRAETGKDFIEAIARGMDVLRAFTAGRRTMTLTEVAAATGLARPTARRILLTLEELGYTRQREGAWSLTPRVLELGTAYVQSQGLWDSARPHMEDLVAQTGESSSIAQLDGSDIVYVSRVAVPKIITFAVSIGTRFPALQTSLGKVLLANLPTSEVDQRLALPSRSGIVPRWVPTTEQREQELRTIRARGWALADEQLAAGIRSAAVPLRDGAGEVIAAMNVTVHAAETSLETLTEAHLPRLIRAAGAISEDIARRDAVPQIVVDRTSS
jgi:IclR family transcriptional regulator, pca regulon regulatory protein